MRVNFLQKTFRFLILLSVALFLVVLRPEKAIAQQITFAQSILPVKIVYLDEKFNVKRIWSNVDYFSSLYVLKFYLEKEKREIEFNKLAFENYQKKAAESCSSNYQNNLTEIKVDFFRKADRLEEVVTYV